MALPSTLAIEPGSFAADVALGLGRGGQKTLPPKYFYDDVGSLLFEAIALLPEYGLAGADARLLEAHAPAILDALPGPLAVAELGSGSGRKTRWLLEAACRRQFTTYFPIDVAALSLERCRAGMAAMAGLRMQPVEAEFLPGLEAVGRMRPAGHRLLLLFLGSSIGNFEPGGAAAFLAAARRRLRPGDALLLGADEQRSPARLRLAYDDPAGVTAAFNRNLLARMNRELGASFEPARFRHVARWNAAAGRVEMHLESLAAQRIEIPGAAVVARFAPGETIHTENSYKFRPGEIAALGRSAGFAPQAAWQDTAWPFRESLLLAEADTGGRGVGDERRSPGGSAPEPSRTMVHGRAHCRIADV